MKCHKCNGEGGRSCIVDGGWWDCSLCEGRRVIQGCEPCTKLWVLERLAKAAVECDRLRTVHTDFADNSKAEAKREYLLALEAVREFVK